MPVTKELLRTGPGWFSRNRRRRYGSVMGLTLDKESKDIEVVDRVSNGTSYVNHFTNTLLSGLPVKAVPSPGDRSRDDAASLR